MKPRAAVDMVDEVETFEAVMALFSESEAATEVVYSLSSSIAKPQSPVSHPPASLNRVHSLDFPESVMEENESSAIDLDIGFQAARQFLDEYDGEGLHDVQIHLPAEQERLEAAEDSGDSSDASAAGPGGPADPVKRDSASPPTSSSTNPKKVRRASQKDQISSLRGTVKELVSELQSLESISTRRKAEQARAGSSKSSGEIVPDSGPLWQKIAARQLERRKKAEEDNAQLRQMLDMQVQEAKNLKRILKRRTKIEVRQVVELPCRLCSSGPNGWLSFAQQLMEEMLGVKRHKSLETYSSNDNLQVFDEMLRNTDDLYHGVDALFAEKRIFDVPCPGRSRHVSRNATNGVFFELLQRTLMPFGVSKTERAVWATLGQLGMESLQCVRDVNAQVDFHAQHSQDTGDTMMTSFVASTSGFQDLSSVHIRKVVRKYVEANRAVFICRMVTKPKLDSGRVGIILRMTQWVVVEKAPPLSEDEEETTLIQSHVSVSRQVPTDQQRHRSAENADLAIAVWDETMSRLSHQVESFVLDETCQQGGARIP
ncbi:hypothetical protein BBJ28_00004085 [Nothophytophthora sp. Chile5]|nr:hypothetical protein BBJ28_00004085 [Nothophytophthora sp. Chile5]